MTMMRTASVVSRTAVTLAARQCRLTSPRTSTLRPVVVFFSSDTKLQSATTTTTNDHRNLNNRHHDVAPILFEGVSKEHSDLIVFHARQAQTSVSLQALMRTGRGEFLHKTFGETAKDVDAHTATMRVLIQVSAGL